MEGWIKLHRKIIEWQWYKDIPTRVLFEHLLLTANHKDNYFGNILVKKGQKLTSIRHLAEETGLSQQAVRTAVSKLKSTHEITQSSTHKYTLITIEKYDLYQLRRRTATQSSTQ